MGREYQQRMNKDWEEIQETTDYEDNKDKLYCRNRKRVAQEEVRKKEEESLD